MPLRLRSLRRSIGFGRFAAEAHRRSSSAFEQADRHGTNAARAPRSPTIGQMDHRAGAGTTAPEEGPPAVTVSDVLQIEEVQVGCPKVLAGRDRLDRAVRWVHVAEVPDIAPLLKGGELILTTGIAFPDQDAGLASYVAELAAAGASGLVVELGRRYSEIPRKLVEAAEREHLPLVAFEHEALFVAITEAVHARILNIQLTELRVEEKVHRAFHALAARASPRDVVRKMSELVHCPVVFENLAHRPLAVTSLSVSLEELLAGWVERSRRLDNDHPGWAAAMVEPRGQPCGRVILLLDQQQNALHRAVLESGADALAVAWLTAGPPSSLEHAAQQELIGDIAADRCLSMNEIYVRSRSLGVVIRHRPLAWLCIRSSQPFCTEDMVARALERLGVLGLVGRTLDDQIYALVTLAEPASGLERLSLIATEVRESATTPSQMAFGAAFVPERPALSDLARAMAQADEAARSVFGSGEDRVVTLEDISLRGVLRLLANDPGLQRFVSGQLRRLWDYDEVHGTHLLEILTVYLDSGGNKSVAAAKSHLSRAAFYNSLDRLTTVLQRDLEQAEVRTALHVAIMASTAAGQPPVPSSRG